MCLPFVFRYLLKCGARPIDKDQQQSNKSKPNKKLHRHPAVLLQNKLKHKTIFARKFTSRCMGGQVEGNWDGVEKFCDKLMKY